MCFPLLGAANAVPRRSSLPSPGDFHRLVLQPCFFAKALPLPCASHRPFLAKTPPLRGLQEHQHVHFRSTEPLPVRGSLRHATKEMINPVLFTYMSSLWLGQGGALTVRRNKAMMPTCLIYQHLISLVVHFWSTEPMRVLGGGHWCARPGTLIQCMKLPIAPLLFSPPRPSPVAPRLPPPSSSPSPLPSSLISSPLCPLLSPHLS